MRGSAEICVVFRVQRITADAGAHPRKNSRLCRDVRSQARLRRLNRQGVSDANRFRSLHASPNRCALSAPKVAGGPCPHGSIPLSDLRMGEGREFPETAPAFAAYAPRRLASTRNPVMDLKPADRGLNKKKEPPGIPSRSGSKHSSVSESRLEPMRIDNQVDDPRHRPFARKGRTCHGKRVRPI